MSKFSLNHLSGWHLHHHFIDAKTELGEVSNLFKVMQQIRGREDSNSCLLNSIAFSVPILENFALTQR
jgi:hypothetical protein